MLVLTSKRLIEAKNAKSGGDLGILLDPFAHTNKTHLNPDVIQQAIIGPCHLNHELLHLAGEPHRCLRDFLPFCHLRRQNDYRRSVLIIRYMNVASILEQAANSLVTYRPKCVRDGIRSILKAFQLFTVTKYELLRSFCCPRIRI